MNKKAQVWIETVLYTLIALALIGLILAFIMPKINQTKDKLIIEQTVTMLAELDGKINEVSKTYGNSRNFDFTIKRSYLILNSTGDEIIFVIEDLSEPYSEPGSTISNGPVKISSETRQKGAAAYLKLSYNRMYNITFNDEDNDKKFSQAPLPYRTSIISKSTPGLMQIDFQTV